jgi:DNA-binding MarR family transcriptional regulator
MSDHISGSDGEISDDLLDLITTLLQAIRTDIAQTAEAEPMTQEWQDMTELRATQGQVKLLRILVARGHCTMQELAEALGVAQPSVTAMVKRLLAQELVMRVRDEQDWRVVLVYPTERGQRAVTLYRELRRTHLRRRLQHLSPEELAHLRAVLPILRHLIEVEP